MFDLNNPGIKIALSSSKESYNHMTNQMEKMMTFKNKMNWYIFIVSFFILFSVNHTFASYPADPNSNLEWPSNSSETTVAHVQAWFNAARANENTQLGTSMPMMTLPSQAEWDSMTDAEKALWLINRERIDRGVVPLHGIESNVMSVAQDYAQYLMDNNAFSHFADGNTPHERLNNNTAIGSCNDFLSVAENLGILMGGWTLPIERAVHGWMYDDSGSSWGHRHAILWYPYNDNSGTSGMEGFLGIGRVHGTFNGWPNSDMIVMNIFDPCSSWVYPVEEIPGDLDGNDVVGLEDAILALMVLSKTTVTATISLDNEVDGDYKIGLSEAIYIMQKIAGLRD
jgi:uncharacterized protein YkwD